LSPRLTQPWGPTGNASAATNVYGPASNGRGRTFSTWASRPLAISDTCDLARANDWTRRSIRRVETPSMYQVAITLVRAASARRRYWSNHSGKCVPECSFGIATSIVPTRGPGPGAGSLWPRGDRGRSLTCDDLRQPHGRLSPPTRLMGPSAMPGQSRGPCVALPAADPGRRPACSRFLLCYWHARAVERRRLCAHAILGSRSAPGYPGCPRSANAARPGDNTPEASTTGAVSQGGPGDRDSQDGNPKWGSGGAQRL
jgi:hypothetical protein